MSAGDVILARASDVFVLERAGFVREPQKATGLVPMRPPAVDRRPRAITALEAEMVSLRQEVATLRRQVAGLTDELRKGGLPPAPEVLDRIRSACADAFDLTEATLCAPSRSKAVARARYAYYLVAHEDTTFSRPAIARAVGRTESTTIYYGLKRANELLAADPDFARRLDIARHALGADDA